MATRLTEKEQRTIITLFEAGKSLAEIKQVTGRSREAIIKLLGEVGLDDNEVLKYAWWLAEDLWRDEHKNCRQSGMDFYSQKPDIKATYVNKAKAIRMETCAGNYRIVMGDKSVNVPNEATETNLANEAARRYMTDAEKFEDKRKFVHNIGNLLMQSREGISCGLTDNDTVTVSYTDGYSYNVNISMDSYLAILRDVVKSIEY